MLSKHFFVFKNCSAFDGLHPEMPRQLQTFSLQPHKSTGVGPGSQGVEPPVREC